MNQSPEDAGRAFLTALERGDWERAAACMHPDTITQFREDVETGVAGWEIRPDAMSADDFARHKPDMPSEVAEYHARKHAEWARERGSELPQLLARVHEPSEIARLSDLELYSRYIEAQDPRYQIRSAYERAGRPAPDSVIHGSVAHVVRTVLGAVVETESLAHVVYRGGWNYDGKPARVEAVDVLTLERTEAGWRARDFDFAGYGLSVDAHWSVPGEEVASE